MLSQAGRSMARVQCARMALRCQRTAPPRLTSQANDASLVRMTTRSVQVCDKPGPESPLGHPSIASRHTSRSDNSVRLRPAKIDNRVKSPVPPLSRLLPGKSVHRLADEVGVSVVPRVLVDHCDEDPTQARRLAVGPGTPGPLPQVAVGQRLRDQARERSAASRQNANSCSGESSVADCQSQSGSAFQSTVFHGAAVSCAWSAYENQ